ncbi:hypothetical protein TARUN_5151 [Trichoderma arundinaceum]|uniref:Uncharacterized protein n=1 Tax=Trichoderma arundinaceum TaxID=490622 RepID=A0A395NMJ7_TRIAR|nr:hypothetical protein TARUN_5151 [Trichoderma arundinaceum]
MLLRILLLAGLCGHGPFAAASVTVPVDPDVDPLPLSTAGVVKSASELLRQSCPEEFPPRTPYSPELLMSSFDDFGHEGIDAFANGTIYASSDSLVRGAIEAWGQHQSLILRPDEVWFEILAQLNFYMTAHAEDIRHLFVDFEGKEEIKVWRFTWGDVIAAFGGEIQKRVKTDWLLKWIMPSFSTSDSSDRLTATVLMMGLMQHYFEFSGGIICGLPEVTLLGVRDDWVRLLQKLDRLKEWGEEPADYAERLRPILQRFVDTWDDPNCEETKNFWKNIVRSQRLISCGAGPADYRISGWITGFLHWTEEGNLRVPRETEKEYQPSDGDLVLDGIPYFPLALKDVPVGYAKAPLKMMDYPSQGQDTKAYLLAGNVGVTRVAVASSDEPGHEDWKVTAQPRSAWFLYGPVNATVKVGPGYGSGDELLRAAAGLGMCEHDDGGLVGIGGDGSGTSWW